MQFTIGNRLSNLFTGFDNSTEKSHLNSERKSAKASY